MQEPDGASEAGFLSFVTVSLRWSTWNLTELDKKLFALFLKLDKSELPVRPFCFTGSFSLNWPNAC